MSRTIPPDGKNTTIDESSQAPQLEMADFPVVIIWQVGYPDGVRNRGVSLVHSQSALNILHRLLQQEHRLFKATTSLKLMRSDNLSEDALAIRLCDNAAHNQRGKPQDYFCHECGKRTRLVRIVDDE